MRQFVGNHIYFLILKKDLLGSWLLRLALRRTKNRSKVIPNVKVNRSQRKGWEVGPMLVNVDLICKNQDP